jgi:hypothetical protein
MSGQHAAAVKRSDFHPARHVFLVAGLIAVATIARWVPHPPNFTPVGAIALFGGAVFGSRQIAALALLAAMLLSDAVLGFHAFMPVVYGCLLFNVWLGRQLHHRLRPLPVVGASLLGSVVFFLATNLVCWFTYYEQTLAGLTTCFTRALPFFQNTLLADFVFASGLFGALALARSQDVLARQQVPASASCQPVA